MIARYRRFAARGRLSMAVLAAVLFIAIGLLLVVGARASNAAFLDSEARNFASLNAGDDLALTALAAAAFAGSAALHFLGRRLSGRQ